MPLPMATFLFTWRSSCPTTHEFPFFTSIYMIPEAV